MGFLHLHCRNSSKCKKEHKKSLVQYTQAFELWIFNYYVLNMVAKGLEFTADFN